MRPCGRTLFKGGLRTESFISRYTLLARVGRTHSHLSAAVLRAGFPTSVRDHRICGTETFGFERKVRLNRCYGFCDCVRPALREDRIPLCRADVVAIREDLYLSRQLAGTIKALPQNRGLLRRELGDVGGKVNRSDVAATRFVGGRLLCLVPAASRLWNNCLRGFGSRRCRGWSGGQWGARR